MIPKSNIYEATYIGAFSAACRRGTYFVFSECSEMRL